MSKDNNKDNNKIRRKKVSSTNNSNSSSKKSSTSSKKKSKSSNKKDKFKFIRVAGILFLVLLVFASAIGTGLVFASVKDVQPVTKSMLDEKTYQTTKIKYSNDTLLSNAPSVNKKEPVELDQISRDLQNAVIAIEDERFYEHSGVDIRGLIRSVVKTLTGTKQGGSTIPMQVSKMLLTTTEQTLTRKVKDIYYAYEMSKTLSKEEILEVYLNNFFVGRGLAGAEAGARGYFDKKAIDLELHEAALLAGATKNPTKLSPYISSKLDGTETKDDLEQKLLFYVNTSDDNIDDPTEADFAIVEKLSNLGLIPDTDTYKQLMSGSMVVRKAINNPDAKKRQELVLMKMLELNFITQEQHDAAVAATIDIRLPKKTDTVQSSVEDLIEYEVIDALIEHGNTEDEAYNMFYNGGLDIVTTIDPSMQDILEDEYKNNNNFPGHIVGPDGVSQPQSSMVVLDYRNGHIKALVGGRNITGRKTLNRATYPQQPGSTIKPLSVYTPAIDTEILTQADVFSDTRGPYKFKDNNRWNPATTTAGTGVMSLRKSLSYSSNTIAVKVAESLGDSYEECVDIMIDYLRNFGITTLKDTKAVDSKSSDRNFSALTLGGMTTGVKPLEMAAAYGTLANAGVYVEPIIFTTISTYDGNLIVNNTPDEVRVVSPEVAYVVTDMLTSVITEGIGGSASISGGMPVAGKTGTTNGALDAWFVGYTPYYVAATYIGDDAGRKDSNGNTIPRRPVDGGSGSSARLWSKVMTKIHSNLTVTKFKVPDNIYFTKINPNDGGKSSTGSNAAFINGTAPNRISKPVVEEKPQVEEKPEVPETPAPEVPETPAPEVPETPAPEVPETPAPEVPETPAPTPPETPPTTPEAPTSE